MNSTHAKKVQRFIGLVICMFLSKELPKAPAGMLAVKCPRCNAVQNVASTHLDSTCWQCHQNGPTPTAKYARMVRCHSCRAIESIPHGVTAAKCTSCQAPMALPH